jgi:hypothetical protein
MHIVDILIALYVIVVMTATFAASILFVVLYNEVDINVIRWWRSK